MRSKERRGFACVGFTMHDLCNSQSGFGFVFGEAQLDKSVGVFSFARYGSPSEPDFLRRCCMVLTHVRNPPHPPELCPCQAVPSRADPAVRARAFG